MPAPGNEHAAAGRSDVGHDVASGAVAMAPAQPERAILVSDDVDLRANVTRILAEPTAGRIEILHARAVGEAVALLAARASDVVLLDMAVAGDPHEAAIAALREACPECALIVITAEPPTHLLRDLFAAGAQDCLVRQCLLANCGASEAAARSAVLGAAQIKRAERRLAFLANHDPLTGLANRALGFELLRRALASARRGNRSMAMLALDLDGFKAVNDALGHDAGDRVLQAVAQRLVGCLREADIVGRLGGDEFVVILDGDATAAAAELVRAKIERALAPPIELPERAVKIRASIGIAAGAAGDTPDSLLARADAAMYRVKRQPRGSSMRPDQRMDEPPDAPREGTASS